MDGRGWGRIRLGRGATGWGRGWVIRGAAGAGKPSVDRNATGGTAGTGQTPPLRQSLRPNGQNYGIPVSPKDKML